MRSNLQDLVRCIAGTGYEVVKVEGDDKETSFKAVSADRTVIMSAVTKEPVDDLKGEFGLSNLSVFGGIVQGKTFSGDDATIDVVMHPKNKDVPVALNFKNDDGTRMTYRLMDAGVVPKQPVFAGTTYEVEIDEPERADINKFADVAGLLSEVEEMFTPEVIDDEVIFHIGDENSASHSASVKFADANGATFKAGFSWPIAQVLNILKLSDNSNTTVKLASAGVMEIGIDTGIAEYTFLLPGHN